MEGTIPDSVFVGREREIGALTARLRTTAAGRGNIVMLAGEPGVGTTSTARAFAAASQGEGYAVLWGAGFEGDLSMP